MRKLTSFSFLALCALCSGAVYAQDTWKGEFYNIMPTRSEVTEEYCKQHVLDTYQTSAGMADKEVTANNGVKAKDLGYTTKEEGGVYVRKGTAELSGTYEGKAWKEKVHYIGLTLMKTGNMEQGAWYSKDCKGFYRVGPMNS